MSLSPANAHRGQGDNTSTVAVFGAGIAGLTVAHELVRRGFSVHVYEETDEAGGFFRSARRVADDGMPSEYSWHGMGPWYHNLYDLLQEIPYDEKGTVFDRALSRPIDFGIFPDDAPAQFYDRGPFSIPAMFRMSARDFLGWAWLMLKSWSANRRSEEVYSRQNAAERWKAVMSQRAYETWRACFGPWIGSDWTRVSLHTAGRFFRNQLLSRPRHQHDGWSHGAGDGWLLLRSPSSEAWFHPWVRDLKRRGVQFHWGESLVRLEVNERRARAAWLSTGKAVQADVYVLATHPFAIARMVENDPELAADPELRKFPGLVQDGPHTQVSVRMAFAKPIAFPRERAAAVLADTEFNLTLFAQEQAWRDEVSLGREVASLWTITSCVGTVPGRVYGLPVKQCSEQQFLDEVKAQILACGSLQALVREANDGHGLGDFPLLRTVVWHEWEFESDGLRYTQPKWVTTTNTHPFRPEQQTSIPNVLLAGAHTRTSVDVWSIEGAVESGRRAARSLAADVRVFSQYEPAWLTLLGRLDDFCYACRLPHILDLTVSLLLLSCLAWFLS